VRYLDPEGEDLLWHPLDRKFGTVGWLVPWSECFATFTRLFHPVKAQSSGETVRWETLAARTGRVWHPEVQFAALAAEDYSAADPANLGPERLAALVRALGLSTDTDCIAALWEGNRWVAAQADAAKFHGAVGVNRAAWDSAGELHGPNHRVYKLFKCALADLPHFGAAGTAVFFNRQPTIVWARDRSFALATDPDYDSSILAGDEQIQDAVLIASDVIECLAVSPETSLLHDADKLNASANGT
jgi:hypothetical protein